jgi:two-component system NarL family response regulator
VLRLLADGLTNKEIGGRLGIAEDTVKKHVQNIIWKLHAADRTQAAIIAYRRGLLDLHGDR